MQPPDLKNPPEGCRFAPRCPDALDRCHKQVPPKTTISSTHSAYCWRLIEDE
ncbi:MAG TPA: hypothetical protein DCD97_01210 [Firmicutes bacterium]|nr:hypothetical protein [Bacillota bacterium]